MSASDYINCKYCSKCKRTLPHNEFYKSNRTSDGLREYCIDCCFEYKGRQRPIVLSPTLPGHKRCRKCSRILPIDNFHKSSYTSDGYKSQCKDCRRAYSGSAKRTGYKRGDGTKQCSKCGKIKPDTVEYFRYQRGKPGQPCRDCHKLAYERYSQDNHELILLRSQDYRKNNPERIRDAGKRYALRHPERLKLSRQKSAIKSRQRRAEYQREYNRKYPEKQKAKTHRRLARKRALPSTFAPVDWLRALDYFNGQCAVCGRPPGLWHKLATDHWIPISSPDCPGTVPTNIVPLCHASKDGADSCNKTKSARDPVEWLTDKFGPRRAKRILARIEAYFQWVKEQDD